MEWQRRSAGVLVGSNNSNRSDDDEVGGGEERRRGGGGEAGMMGSPEGVLCVKVMTDEQMEVLRRQIAVYATICEQLVEMHKAFTAHQDSIAGMRLGSLYSDHLMVPGGHRITARQRWTPTSMQLQILEDLFDRGNGTPSKQKIKEITIELSQHGQISETNVYNWFQNRRARSKRKQTATLPDSNEPETEADDESPKEKKPKPDNHPHENLHIRVDNHLFHNAPIGCEVHLLDPELSQNQGMYLSNESSKSSGSSGQISFYEHVLSNQRVDHLMENPGSYITFHSGESYDMIG